MEKKDSTYLIVSFFLLVLLLLLIQLTFCSLEFDLMRSDVESYWNDNLKISAPFNPWHVPLFPLTIFVIRTLSANVLQPIIYMQAITIISLFTSAYLVFRIITGDKRDAMSEYFGLIIVWIYLLWPFEGLTSIIFPIADQLAFCLFFAGLFFVLQNKTTWGFTFWGLSLVAHKGLWAFVFLCVIASIIDSLTKKSINERIVARDFLLNITILMLPLCTLWIAGFVVEHDLLWIFRANMNEIFFLNRHYPIFDGLFGSFQGGLLKSLVKGGALLVTLLLSILTLWVSVKKTYSRWRFGVAISIPVMILMLIEQQDQVWAVYRFGRLLIVPIGWIAVNYLGRWKIRPVYSKLLLIIMFMLLTMSQFAFAWYMATVFFAS